MQFDDRLELVGMRGRFQTGVVVSFDFIYDDLKRYYSQTSPQGAYAVIERAFVSEGFQKLGDSDYKHDTMNEAMALKIIADFAKKEKWFPVCIKKVIVSPNVPNLDISNDIRAFYTDDEWKREKDAEYGIKVRNT